MIRHSEFVFVTVFAILLNVCPALAGMVGYDLVNVDWHAAIATLNRPDNRMASLRSLKPISDQVAKQKPFEGLTVADSVDLATVNAVTAMFRGSITAAGSPVLLPFDFSKLSEDLVRAGSVAGAERTAAYFGRLRSLLFYPGPYGYRAYFQFKKTSTVMVSGSSVYQMLGNPVTPKLESCTSLIATARKAPSDNDAKELFFAYLTKYERRIGAIHAEYFGEREAAIPCLFAGALIEVHILCDVLGDSDCTVRDLAQEVVSNLSFVGGAPREKRHPGINDPLQRLSAEADQLEAVSIQSRLKQPEYALPGDLIAGTGVNGKAGSKDSNIYGPLLFPTDLSAAAQTVVYRSDEECLPGDKDHGSTCETRTGQTIVKATPGKWRDNFCEARSGNKLYTCPEGRGHAGQDIWGKGWNTTPLKFPLRAVVDGIAFRRFPSQPAVTVSDVNGSNIDYIYRHMRPSDLDRNGIVASKPREVSRGCTMAQVDRLQNVSAAKTAFVDKGIYYDPTAKHLHFEIRIPTKSGFQNVSPYQTVVSAHRAAVTKADTSPASTKSCL
jgi:hypothetical protein